MTAQLCLDGFEAADTKVRKIEYFHLYWNYITVFSLMVINKNFTKCFSQNLSFFLFVNLK